MSKVRAIALYLPQYHPIPENDNWWGKGFTEWTNVGKAKPLFPGHYQPHVPADMGYYDLRVPEVREAQAELAREYGIEGFCYWHYWFGNGKQLLDRPFNEVLSSGRPNFPFCIGWANESWKGFYHGLSGRNVLIEQKYPGEEDYTNHFMTLLPAFQDKRYIRVNGKPLVLIYNPQGLPDAVFFIYLWQKLAKDNNLPGLHFVGHTYDSRSIDKILSYGFDAVNVMRIFDYTKDISFLFRIKQWVECKMMGFPRIVSYNYASRFFVGNEDSRFNVYPSIIPNWDHTPRTGRKGVVFHNSNPKLFAAHLSDVKKVLSSKPEESRIVFIKSWNEWAEGNYLEPDLRWGKAYLEEVAKAIK
ncbi:MAG: glycoside hydrolase family 99-like domain-containing protein [Bacteroidaceae bacterium]|nr:glycoside hydrolase family 99-like domain-containing protein [Bacteroidaceae bacterium]